MKFRNGIEKKEKYIRKDDKNNKGFTLVETLIVVGIIAVLLLVSILGITKYLRVMKQIEMDNAAKEIFVAAQNHLSTADTQGYLDRDGDSANIGTLDETTTKYKDKNVYYYIVKNGKTDMNLNNTATFVNLMLPAGSVDETVRTGGSYIICFQKETAKVLDVFYAENDSRYKHTFEDGEYATLMGNYRDVDGADKKKERKTYGEDKSVIGYYGGDDVGIPEGKKLSAPKIKVVNDDKLCVKVTNPNKDWKVENAKGGNYSAELKLLITGETSGNTKEIILSDSGNGESAYLASLFADTIEYEVEDEKNINTYTIVLDDVTTKSTDGKNRHFSSLFCGAGENALLAGEDITIQATAQSTVAFTNIASSGKQTINSLFADYDKDENIAYISSIRHLENIDYDISGIDVIDFPVEKAEQMTNLTWSGFRNNIKLGNEFFISKSDGSKRTLEKDCFSPIKNINREKNTVALDYDGKNHYLSDFKIYEKGGAGVFKELAKDSKVQNLQIINFDVESTDGNAGALAASATQTDIKNVLVRNNLKTIIKETDYGLEVTAKLDAGGLVGKANGGTIDETAAAVYVKSTAGNAGGLIGTIDGTKLKHSYSGGHTSSAQFSDFEADDNKISRINVQAIKKCGGLIGEALSDSEIEFCYSTCSAKGETAGGLVGNIDGGKIENSYATGKMFSNSEDVETGDFVGTYSNSTSNSTEFYNNKYVENMSDNSKKEEITGVTGIAGQSTEDTDFIIAEENKSQAAAYDPMLIVSYKGRYSFPTIKMMDKNIESESSFLKYHYGDWQIPELVPVDFRLINGDKLILQMDLKNTKDSIYTVVVEGLESHAIKVLRVQLKDGNPSIIKEGTSTGGAITWSAKIPEWTISLTDAVGENPASVNIVFDDITSVKNHFCELFPNHRAGEDIDVKVVGGEFENVKATKEFESRRENSLFAAPNHVEDENKDKGTSSEGWHIGNAYIAYIRHLQNLDSRVSNVDDAVTKAYVLFALNWDAAKYPTVYNYNHEASIANSFYGIYNNNLVLFDGNNCLLSGFVINGAVDFGNGMGIGNAGLFRYVSSSLTIKDMRMDDCTVKATAGNAGTVVAEIKNGKNNEVSINSVLVTSAEYQAIVTARYYSGGIAGKAETPIKIDNCASSVTVYGGSAAGGLVGLINTSGDTSSSISSSYVGGHTVEAKYSDREYNITSDKGASGGIVGAVNSGSLNVTKTFSAASVIGKTAGGGIIGEVNSNAGLTDTYTIATVKGVAAEKAGVEASTKDGAVIGVLTGRLTANNCYYLDEIYPDHELDAGRKSNIPYIGTGKENITGNIEPNSYQEDNGETNPISARSMGEMQDGTEVYDGDLMGKEYPYKIWTKFADWNENPVNEGSADVESDEETTYDLSSLEKEIADSKKKAIYYGDWQPVLVPQSETVNVQFYSLLPGKTTPEKISNACLGTQTLYQNKENRVLAPETENIKGYEIGEWILTEDINDLAQGVELETDNGFIIFNKEDCNNDIDVVAKYEKNPDEAIVRFMYDDPTDDKTQWSQLGSDRVVKKGTEMRKVFVPEKEYSGYRIVGWYSDKSCSEDKKIDFSSGTVQNDIDAYAKYEKMEYFYVYLDFYYQVDNNQRPELLKDVPIVSLNMDNPQYVFRVSVSDGEDFDKYIDLPNLEGTAAKKGDPVVVGAYENNEFVSNNREDISYNSSSGKLHIKTGETKNYFVVYKVKGTETYTYKVNYIFDDTDQNSKISLNTYKNGFVDDSNLKYNKSSSYEVKSEKRTYSKYLTPDISEVSLDLNNGWSRSTKKIELTEARDGNVDYYINVEYKRNDFALSYDCRSGTYIDPVKLTYGQPLSTATPQNNPERNGYLFDEWVIHSKTATENPEGSYKYVSKEGEAESYSWNSTMPDKNMIATAKWKAGKSKYKVMYWYEDVLGRDHAHQHTIDCFQKDAVDISKEKIYYNECSFEYSYNEVKTISHNDMNVSSFNVTSTSGETLSSDEKRKTKTQTGTWEVTTEEGITIRGTCKRTQTIKKVLGIWQSWDDDKWTAWIDTTNNKVNYKNFRSVEDTFLGIGIGTYKYYIDAEFDKIEPKSLTINFGSLDTNNKTNVQTFTTDNEIYINNSGTDKVYCKYSNGEWYICDSSGKLSNNIITVTSYHTGEFIYKYNNKKVNINFTGEAQDTMIYGWSYENEGVIHKCIYLNGIFYNYTGETRIGEKAKCNSAIGVDSGFNYVGSVEEEGTTDSSANCSNYKNYQRNNGTGITETWIDKEHFTFNEELSDKNVQIKADGSTVVNVYFNRNEYTLTFKVYTGIFSSMTVKTITALYEADIHNYFPIQYEGNDYSWRAEDAWSGSAEFNNKVQTIDRMPGNNITFMGQTKEPSKLILYYLEKIPGRIYKGEGEYFKGENYDYELNMGGDWNKSFYLYKSVYHDFLGLTDNEEFHKIYGFDKYGYYYLGSNLKYYEDSGFSVLPTISSGNVVKFFYSRKSYDLEFYVKMDDGIKQFRKPIKVLYEKNLGEYSSIRPDNPPAEDYVFDGYYKDPECTEPITLSSYNMPAGNVAVYCRWKAPNRTVNFYWDDTLTAKYGDSVVVEKEKNLDGVITDASGDLLNVYKPDKDGYFFEGWYYKDNGVEKPFIYSQKISDNMNVYAKWTADEKPDLGKNDVTVRYLKGTPKDYEDKEPSSGDRLIPDKVIKDSSIGDTIMIKADNSIEKDDKRYYSNDSIEFHKVSKIKEDNTVTFYYKELENWNYNIEYYVTFSSMDYSTIKDSAVSEDGKTNIRFTDEASYLVWNGEEGKTDNYYETVSFQLPKELEGCYLDHYEYEGEKGSGNIAVIHPNQKGTGTIKYYLKIDPNDLYVEDRNVVYDGKGQAKPSESRGTIKIGNLEIDTYNLYTYYSFDGKTKLSKNEVVDAGVYSLNGYIVYCVDKTQYFLIYKDETKNLKLRVEKRPITIKSASVEKEYDGTPLTACTNDDITITAPDGDAFVLNEGIGEKDDIEVIFSVEAFRLNPGTTKNSFTYKAKENTNLNNYFITTEFGDLTVTE